MPGLEGSAGLVMVLPLWDVTETSPSVFFSATVPEGREPFQFHETGKHVSQGYTKAELCVCMGDDNTMDGITACNHEFGHTLDITYYIGGKDTRKERLNNLLNASISTSQLCTFVSYLGRISSHSYAVDLILRARVVAFAKRV
jgi:hypothetical protein